MALFEINNLKFWYPGAEKAALDGIHLKIEPGEFVVICGKSGCGKTTLLRHLKSVLTPYGRREGEILYQGQPLETVSARKQAGEIGYVMQSPDNQIVTDKVWHELAFGVENLGYDQQTIRLRVAEMASFFGIQNWFHKKVEELSGGQKQLLNLASIMTMQPKVLVLDEPTSQLDPIAAGEFLSTIRKINLELGTTIIMIEHRLEEVFPMADKVLVLEDGMQQYAASPREVGKALAGNDLFLAMPAPVQIYEALGQVGECPLTVCEGRKWLSLHYAEVLKKKQESEQKKAFEEKKSQIWETNKKEVVIEAKEVWFRYERELPDVVRDLSFQVTQGELFCILGGNGRETNKKEVVIEAKEVWFRYERELPDVVRDLSFQVTQGELFCILGGNGTGKSTTLSLISGIRKPYRGKILLKGQDIRKKKNAELAGGILGVLPQNPQDLFVKDTVLEDLKEMFEGWSREKRKEEETLLAQVIADTQIEHLLKMHPYDLSGGEQQRAALAKVLLLEPEILLLDEPTKGLDGFYKQKLADIFQNLKKRGTTILMVSHDIEFCASYADRCAMFFDGGIVISSEAKEFFTGNSFYTTAANRMARHLFPEAVTVKDVVEACRTNKIQE